MTKKHRAPTPASEAFRECWKTYLRCRNSAGRISNVSLSVPSSGGSKVPCPWRFPAVSTLYVADFERAAERALRHPGWEKRELLFDLAFLRLVEYRELPEMLGTAQGTVDWWYAEVKKAVGIELMRCGVYPLAAYWALRGQRRKRGAVRPILADD